MPIQEGGRFSPQDAIVSPGVFTRELDLSGITQGVADIGAAIVAPFPKGPGFTPTLVTSVYDLETKFGVADGVYYGPYTAKEYLNEKGFVTVVRVGALTGYNQDYPLAIYAQKGTWNRNQSKGALVSGSSFVNYSGDWTATGSVGITFSSASNTPVSGSSATYSGYTSTFGSSFSSSFVSSSNWSVLTASSTTWANGYTLPANTYLWYTGSTSGSLTFSSSISWTFQSVAADDDILSATSTSGSVLLAGQSYNSGATLSTTILRDPITFFSASYVISYPSSGITASVFTYYSASVPDLSSTSDGAFNVVNNNVSSSVASSVFSGSFVSSVDLVSSNSLFNGAKLISGSFSTYVGTCAQPVIRLAGVLSGSFGKYNGTFTSDGTPSVDACNVWSSGSGETVLLAVLSDTRNATITNLSSPGFNGSTLTSASVLTSTSSSIEQDYYLTLSGSNLGSYGVFEFSLDSSSPKYIENVFGTDPTAVSTTIQLNPAYLYTTFTDTIKRIANNSTSYRVGISAVPSGIFSGSKALNFTDANSFNPANGDSNFGLTSAYTPFIVSQKVASVNGTTSRYELFKAHTLSDGTNTNKQYKIEISDVKLAGTVAGTDWGTFTLSVRDYNDTTKRPKYLETFTNLSLDPDSSNFIARRIGDRYNYISYSGKIIEFGTYANVSKNIRIEMTSGDYPVTVVPYGFNPYDAPVAGDLDNVITTMKYSRASLYGTQLGKYPSGVVFDAIPITDAELVALYPTASVGVETYNDNVQYFAPVPSGATNGNNVGFALDDVIVGSGTGSILAASLNGSIPSTPTASETTYVKLRKFVLGFQGGFDGQSPTIPINVGSSIIPGNTQGLDCTTISSAGSVAYKQCIGALGNADEFDINLIALPGIFNQHHSYVTTLTIDMCEARGDCFYIMDNVTFPSSNQSVGLIDAAISNVSTIDSNYVGTYYPWVKIIDTNTNKIISVPPSVVLPAVYAANDKASAEWFAPAGLNRGGITQAVQTLDRLTHSERDTLYEGRVNPIAAFPGQGICVWGQKTLQVESSALDRINVRRLLINLKKYIASTSKYLVFEQNVAATRNRFLSIVNPYLENVQQRSGLYAFQVKMDDTNNTPDIVDRNILYGQIYLQPTKTSEFIVLDFNLLPTGATFPNA
jgi:hypothetical protein